MIITGYGTLANAQEAFHFGVGNLISKPFNVADIIATGSKAFDRRSEKMKIKGLIRQIQGLRSLNESKEIFFK